MADERLVELFTTQKSLTEWLADIRHRDAAVLRHEDNEKRERLRLLHDVIGLPFDEPTQFKAAELSEQNPVFSKFLQDRGDELCALRLIPVEENLPKLRMRGKTIVEAFQWYREQNIDPKKYRADFVPHPAQNTWSTIFIVNAKGIQGEIIRGGAHQLTQGFHDEAKPMIFRYDFKTWSILPEDKAALAYLRKTTALLKTVDQKKQALLHAKLGATFTHDYLAGYFETTHSPSFGTWYIDYSKALGDMYADLSVSTSVPQTNAILTGRIGCSGIARGPVCIVQPDNIGAIFPEGAVLVCSVTTPLYVPLMERAAAIVTDQGGILSHAAIVARELKKPCLVGTESATTRLHNGQMVLVDANEGTVTDVPSR